MANAGYRLKRGGTIVESARRTTAAAVFWLAIAAVVQSGCKEKPAPTPPPPPATKPATTTTTPATTAAAATQPEVPRTFVQLVRAYYPDCAATQPLDSPLDRKDGARIILKDPIYLDRYQNLWITRADAEPTERVLATASAAYEHLVREEPAYVHWRYEPAKRKNQTGHSTPVLVVPASDGKTVEFVEETRRVKVAGQAEKYYWPDAFSYNDAVVVGNATGASVFQRSDEGWTEIVSPALVEAGSPHAVTQVPVGAGGLLAYVPAENGLPGSKATAKFADGKWSLLSDAKEWPGNFLHLIPLSDGSVLQIVVDPPSADEANDPAEKKPNKVHLAITTPTDAQVNRKAVLELVDQLGDRDAEKRKAAFEQLAVYGSTLWPVLEEQMPKRPDAVKEMLEKLLKNKLDPTLGEMSLVDPRLRLVARTPDGGALFYDEGGVSITNVDGDATLAAPAWISALPGQPIKLLIGQAWNDLTPEHKRFYSLGGADWIISDEAKGPEEVVGTFDLAPILRKSEVRFGEFVGADRRGRLLFREPPQADGARPSNETLILDPTLPPVAARLPVWTFEEKDEGASVGWNEADWPAYKDKVGNVWVIDADGFHVQPKDKGKYFSEPSDVPRLREPATVATSRATTRSASSRPATTRSGDDEGPLLLIQADGTRYYGGMTSLRRVGPDGSVVEWPLPGEIQGSVARPWLVADKDGRLFLFNAVGRLVRLRYTPGGPQPFHVDATFAHRIPNSEPTRIWVDPADRLVIAHDGNQMAVCFPAGVVPAQLADKLPGDVRDDEPDADDDNPKP